MKTTILTFGVAREIFNSASKEMDLKDGITVAELKSSLETAYPEMKKLHSYLVAVNSEYAGDDQTIHAEDELAIIPPVSGG